MYSDGMWVLWVVGGAVLVVSGYMVSSLSTVFIWRRPRRENAAVKDSAELRMVLREWETFVVTERGTIRAVKRFANRVRFLVGTRSDGEVEIDVEAMVGFVALESCGWLDSRAERFDFNEWREKQGSNSVLPQGWVRTTNGEQWEAYRKLVERTGLRAG